MAGRPDIGGQFEQMKRRAKGGRRLDDRTAADGGGASDRDVEPVEPAGTKPRSRASGGLTGRLKDILGRGRSAATKTAERTGDKVRTRTTKTSKKRRRRRLPDEGVVAVEYSPRVDGDPDPGEVVWAWVPYEEDPTQGKDRPMIIIGRRRSKLVGVPLTTKRNDREAQIAIGTGEWDPKRRSSYARIWRMLDIDPDTARREGAILDRRRFDAVITAVDEYYDIRMGSSRHQEFEDLDY